MVAFDSTISITAALRTSEQRWCVSVSRRRLVRRRTGAGTAGSGPCRLPCVAWPWPAAFLFFPEGSARPFLAHLGSSRTPCVGGSPG